MKVVFFLGILFMSAIALLSPWATYLQIAAFTTPVTIAAVGVILCIVLTNIFRFSLKTSSPTFYLSTYVILIILSLRWTSSPLTWGNYALWWTICLAVFIGAQTFLTSPSQFKLVIYGSLLGVLITTFRLGLADDSLGFESGRYVTFGHNANFTAYIFSGVLLIFLIGRQAFRYPRALRLITPAVVLGIFASQLLLGARGGLISSAFICAVYVSRKYCSPQMHSVGAMLMFIASLLTSVGAFQHLLVWIDSLSSRSTGDLSGRTEIWAEAIKSIEGSPILGIGPGAFAAQSTIEVGAHNFFLTISLETGLIGMIVMSLFFTSFVRSIRRNASRRNGSYLVMMFSAYWFPIVTSGHWELAPFSWLIVGFVLQVSRMEFKTKPSFDLTPPPGLNSGRTFKGVRG